MLKIRKYVALALVFLPLILANFVAQKFLIEEGNEIYNYIPAEADVLIELNTRNFIKELAFHRIFNEAYFKEKVIDEGDNQKGVFGAGANYFDRIVAFRESWPDEKIWSLVFSFTNKKKLKKFVANKFPEAQIYFSKDRFALVQLTPSKNQEKLTEHLNRTVNRDLKPLSEKVEIKALFNREKEVNFYFAPQITHADNQIIDGILSLDFLKDHIAITGHFTPVTGFHENQTIKYRIDTEKAISFRSSIDVLRPLSWFTGQSIEQKAYYSQLAMDYDGIDITFTSDKSAGIPAKTYPHMALRTEFGRKDEWKIRINEFLSENDVIFDTTSQILKTKSGSFFNYRVGMNYFAIHHDGMAEFKPEASDSIYLAFHFRSKQLFDNINVRNDEENPVPEKILKLQKIGLEATVLQSRDFEVIETIDMNFHKSAKQNIRAHGKIDMEYKAGHSMVECLYLNDISSLILTTYF